MEENLAKKIEQITIPFAIYFSRKWSPFSYNIPQIVPVFIVCFGYIPFAIRTSVSYGTTFATPPGLVAVASKHETNIKKVTLLLKGIREKYKSIHKMGLLSLEQTISPNTISISFPWSCEGRRYIIAKEDLLTASCDSCRPLPRHHVLVSCSIHTPEIAIRNTLNREFLFKISSI